MKKYRPVVLFYTILLNSFVMADATSIAFNPPLTSDIRLVDESGNILEEVVAEKIALLESHIVNTTLNNQTFIHFFRINDKEGITVSLSWMTGRLLPHEAIDIAMSWLPEKGGEYAVETFTWDGVKDPKPLAFNQFMTVNVTPSFTSPDMTIEIVGLKDNYQIGEKIQFHSRIIGFGSSCGEFWTLLYELDEIGRKNRIYSNMIVPDCPRESKQHGYDINMPVGEPVSLTINSTGPYFVEVRFRDLGSELAASASQFISVVNKQKTIMIDTSKEITIANADSTTGITSYKALLTINSVDVYLGDIGNLAVKPGFITLNFTYSISNIDKNPYYALLDFEAIVQDHRYTAQSIGGAFGMVLLPHETRSSFVLIQVVENVDEVTLVIKDPYARKTVWTVLVDLG